MKTLIPLSIAALMFGLCHVESAQAQGYVGGGCQACGDLGRIGTPYGLGRISPYASGLIPTPPYFALHPPVYYSQPVPRTYGYSPYAYPPQVMTPAMPTTAAAIMENPYATPAKANGKTAKVNPRMVQKPLEILNPHAESGTRLVSQEVR